MVNSNQASLASFAFLSPYGNTLTLKHLMETPLNLVYLPLLIDCSLQCNQDRLCRTFVYDKNSSLCQLYQSDLQNGNITLTSSITSVVGRIRYTSELFLNYNQTCDQCDVNRYLTCQNGRCQCPPPTTFWDGQMCQNQLYYGQSCNQSNWCRTDLNLTCVFGSCQSSSALCALGATAITFDDIPNPGVNNGLLPSGYKGFNWTNGKYLNATAYNGTGYDFVISSGEYVSWFNSNATLQLITTNQTFTLNSCILAAGWSNYISLSMIGYYSSTQLYSRTISLNTHTKIMEIFNWSGLDRVVFSPSGSGYLDVGLDNLCVTL